ncbi:MAG: GlsB/YeaQ/YmgE family stress response membrane protein [Chloroflexota bacterium]
MLMTFIAWLVWLIIGAIVGGITSLIQRRNYALMTNIIFGILSAFIGGVVFDLFGLPTITDFNPLSILGALVGAVLVLVVLHTLKRRRVVAVKEVDAPNNAVTQPLISVRRFMNRWSLLIADEFPSGFLSCSLSCCPSWKSCFCVSHHNA